MAYGFNGASESQKARKRRGADLFKLLPKPNALKIDAFQG
jgi:hypothetical protein